MTAHVMKGDREMCLEAGMNDYISKPVDADSLARVLSRHICGMRMPLAVPATIAPGEGATVFDGPNLFRRMDNNSNIVSAVIASFLEVAPKHIEQARQAINEKNHSAVYRLGHTLKGSSANVSAFAMSAVALQIEAAGKEGNLDSAGEFLQTLEEEFEKLKKALAGFKIYCCPFRMLFNRFF